MNSDWQDVSKKVLRSPHDFTLWQLLIHTSETQLSQISESSLQHSQHQLLRESYRALLLKYPLFSKYWSAFAIWEYRLGFRDEAAIVFLEGMRFVSYDVQYWLEFLNFKLETITDSTEEMLYLFEEARSKIGFTYYSSEFYSLYISFLKRYATTENGYEKKMIILLRQIIEIPLYNASYFFKLMLELISARSITYNKLRMLIPEPNLRELKVQTKNDLSKISRKLEKIFTDSFVVTQYESYQIFGFERRLGKYLQFRPEPISCGDIELWSFYLLFIEQKYPFAYVQQLYERVILVSAYYSDFVIQYFDLLLREQQINNARSLMEKVLSLHSTLQSFRCLIRLIDLEISVNRIHRCRDLIIAYLEVNEDAPLELYEKMIQIEVSIDNGDNGKILCELMAAILAKTKSCRILMNLKFFTIADDILSRFFSEFTNDGGKYYKLGKQIKIEECEYFKELYRSDLVTHVDNI